MEKKLNGVSLIAFAREHGKMRIVPSKNKKTNEPFTSVLFGEPEDGVWAKFSSKLGILTPQQVAEMKDDLQVIENSNKDLLYKYTVCKQGQLGVVVDLGI